MSDVLIALVPTTGHASRSELASVGFGLEVAKAKGTAKPGY